ncbi:rhodanese-like domain-containing protein [Micromonospora sonneratiae]|uniref:Rhodanese-like domain-containing protein n=1 Tax=Micromonospora sonneratiae TaxID=1184706 RepID=A0ABW3YK44_9ACTN
MTIGSPNPDSADLDPVTAHHLVGRGALLVDVREPDEWAAGHAPAAIHVPLGELDPAALPAGRDIIAVCRSGRRSGRAVDELRAAGRSARNLAGGMQAWAAADLPVRDDQGRPGIVA